MTGGIWKGDDKKKRTVGGFSFHSSSWDTRAQERERAPLVLVLSVGNSLRVYDTMYYSLGYIHTSRFVFFRNCSVTFLKD